MNIKSVVIPKEQIGQYKGDLLKCVKSHDEYKDWNEGDFEISFTTGTLDPHWQSVQAIFFDESAEVKDGDMVYVDVANVGNRNIWEYKTSPCPMPYWGNPYCAKKIIAAYPLIEGIPLPTQSFMSEFADKNGEGEIWCEMVQINGTARNMSAKWDYATIDGRVDLRWKESKVNPLATFGENTVDKPFVVLPVIDATSQSLEERAKEYAESMKGECEDEYINEQVAQYQTRDYIAGFQAATSQSDKDMIDFAIWKDKYYARVMGDERYYDTRLAHSSFYTITQLLAIYKSRK